ncbi:MAG: hypothetical protein ACE366_13185 [Bradymonadia bacterium]
MKASHLITLAMTSAVAVAGCDQLSGSLERDERNQQVGYRTGTAADDYRSNGERGNFQITEVHWAGSVKGDLTMSRPSRVYDPDDDFIELQNKHNRAMFVTGWLLTIETGNDSDGLTEGGSRQKPWARTYVIPAREDNRPIEPNQFLVIANKRDGAFADADIFIEGLALPEAPFSITLRDLDERLIDGAGDERKRPFAGGYDLVSARSMERIQLIFNNRGNREAAWHSYALNDPFPGLPSPDPEAAALHVSLRRRIAEEFRPLTFATPGMPNSPDYSGFVSSGDFQ